MLGPLKVRLLRLEKNAAEMAADCLGTLESYYMLNDSSCQFHYRDNKSVRVVTYITRTLMKGNKGVTFIEI